jgi:superfamily II DNA helicase RecQ
MSHECEYKSQDGYTYKCNHPDAKIKPIQLCEYPCPYIKDAAPTEDEKCFTCTHKGCVNYKNPHPWGGKDGCSIWTDKEEVDWHARHSLLNVEYLQALEDLNTQTEKTKEWKTKYNRLDALYLEVCRKGEESEKEWEAKYIKTRDDLLITATERNEECKKAQEWEAKSHEALERVKFLQLERTRHLLEIDEKNHIIEFLKDWIGGAGR